MASATKSTENKGGPGLLSISLGGKKVKTGALYALFAMLVGGTGFAGVKMGASDDMAEIKQQNAEQNKLLNNMAVSMAEMNVTIKTLMDSQAEDKARVQRQIDYLRGEIEKARNAAVSERRVKELERRIAELERRVK